MNKNFKELFSFSKKELNGLLVFCIILVFIAIFPAAYSYLNPPKAYNYSDFKREVEAFRASATTKETFKYKYPSKALLEEKTFSGELFTFNPNNLSELDWKRLGLSDRQIKVIKNYESKGGKFYRKEDLKKIYSIKPDEYARLEPFIDIPSKADFYKPTTDKTFKKTGLHKIAAIDINSADSSQLEALNGIGPAFASRIIKYRNRLGGFYKKEQLKEVYGLDSTMYQKVQQYVIINQGSIKQIQLNTATFDDLKKHPYLSYKQMNAIIKYRTQHGEYKDIKDLRAIAILNEDLLNKISPYLSFTSK